MYGRQNIAQALEMKNRARLSGYARDSWFWLDETGQFVEGHVVLQKLPNNASRPTEDQEKVPTHCLGLSSLLPSLVVFVAHRSGSGSRTNSGQDSATRRSFVKLPP
jgi:hypothetical protein